MPIVAAPQSPSFSGSPGQIVSQVFNDAWDKANTYAASTQAAFDDALSTMNAPPTLPPSLVTVPPLPVADMVSAVSVSPPPASEHASVDGHVMPVEQVPVVGANIAFDAGVLEPMVNIPMNAEAASVERFNEMADLVIDKLAGLFRGYISEYFPSECQYMEKAQQWVCRVLTTGGTGMSRSVEDQIYQRDRARVLGEATRATETILASFASRGYPVPPGAAQHQAYLVQTEAQRQIASASRDVAIKQAEIEIENVRFAVDKAIGLYATAIGAAGDYIRAMAIGPQAGMQIVPSVTDSQSRLISAASDYYRARISVKELELKAKVPNAEFQQAASMKRADQEHASALFAASTRRDILFKDADYRQSALMQDSGSRITADMRSAEFAQSSAMKNADTTNTIRMRAFDAVLGASGSNAELTQRANEKSGDWEVEAMKGRLAAAIEAAKSLATMAAAALNGLHAQAGVSASARNSVGYNYGGDVNADVSPKTVI